MKIIVDRINDDRQHALCRADICLILSKVPPEWSKGINVVRLSSSRKANGLALYNDPDGILTIASRGRTIKETLHSVLVELATRAFGVKHRTFLHLQARYKSKIESAVGPLMNELLPLLTQEKHLLTRTQIKLNDYGA